MPIEYQFTEPETVTCMKIVTPAVLAEEEAQMGIDSTFHMPELAKKIDHIDGRVLSFEAEPVFIHEHMGHWHMVIPKEWHGHFHDRHGGVSVIKKILVSGVLHKQIYYVNKDDQVKHVAEDVPFSKLVELKSPQPVLDEDEVVIRHFKPRIDVTWDLVRGNRLHQIGVVIVRIKIVEDRQVFVQLCPTPGVCPIGNLLEDPGLEIWSGNVPVFWGATNVAPTSIAHSGSSAAELGVPNPKGVASLFQTVRGLAVAAGRVYKLSFWMRENLCPFGTPVSDFTLTAELRFFDSTGMQLDGVSQGFTSAAVPDNSYQQFTLNPATAPAGAASVLVRFTFQPGANNNNMVKIDDVNLACTGGF